MTASSKSLFALGFVFLLALSSSAQIRLPKLISDGMVLQRDSKIKIWGWAGAGEKVSVKFQNKTYKATAEKDGKWNITLPSLKAGGPYVMELQASNKIAINNILVGDVWLCSGQSNMVHQMILHRERYEDEIANSKYPQIRHFWIPTTANLVGAQDDLSAGSWKEANPENVLQFSAVAYFFAKKIYDKYKVPIGLINASVGGTPVEAWTSEEGLKDFSSIVATIGKNKDTAYVNNANRTAAARAQSMPKPQDKGMMPSTPWYDTNYIPKNWRNITVPGYWEDQGVKDLDGIVWYRKEIEVPQSMVGVPAKVALGRIVDADFLYVNGKQVGNTTYQYPQRRYTVPAGLLKPGKNVLVVRVINNFGKGGFVPDKPYYLSANKDTIDLKGDWQYKVGDVFVPQAGGGGGISAQNQPTALYNAMIAPLTNYSVKGFLWYQGESNISNASMYDKLLAALIGDWRSKWKANLPFLYAQLPGFGDVRYLPGESQWAVLREAQLATLAVPNTAMAVTIDAGEWNDIHPDGKKEVGDRLALAADKLVYGDTKIVSSGPIYQSSKIDGGKIILSFSNVGSGLISNDGEELSEFAIAGSDKKFVWAKAKIEGDKVIVWNDNIANPMYVRYAWADNPDNPNLYNKEGLPASPFKTDK